MFDKTRFLYLHCALASCGAVYCSRSCLWVCDSGRAVSTPYYCTASARAVFVSLSAFFIDICCFIPLQLPLTLYMGLTVPSSLYSLDFKNSGQYAISDCHIFAIFVKKIQICAYFYVDKQNLVKIGQSAVELLCILDFQNGSRPPSWIWYDVTADHPRLVFDGPNTP